MPALHKSYQEAIADGSTPRPPLLAYYLCLLPVSTVMSYNGDDDVIVGADTTAKTRYVD